MIGGNINAIFQSRLVATNAIGEEENTYTDKLTLKGYLDLQNGSYSHNKHNAKVEESTHVFICDYQPLDFNADEVRAVINGRAYEVTFIDDPMELHDHLEIFLKIVGVANE